MRLFFTIIILQALLLASPGDLDKSFGNDGKVFTKVQEGQSETLDEAYSVAIQSNGKIVVAGGSNSNNNNPNLFAIVRYNPDSTLDKTFGGDGKVVTGIGSIADEIKSIVIRDDGSIIVSGSTRYRYGSNGTEDDIVLARYSPDGTYDATFTWRQGHPSHRDYRQARLRRGRCSAKRWKDRCNRL